MEKRSVIVPCRNKIILQIIFISAKIICFCRNKLFLPNIRQKQIFCYLVPQILVSVFLLKFRFGRSPSLFVVVLSANTSRALKSGGGSPFREPAGGRQSLPPSLPPYELKYMVK